MGGAGKLEYEEIEEKKKTKVGEKSGWDCDSDLFNFLVSRAKLGNRLKLHSGC